MAKTFGHGACWISTEVRSCDLNVADGCLWKSHLDHLNEFVNSSPSSITKPEDKIPHPPLPQQTTSNLSWTDSTN